MLTNNVAMDVDAEFFAARIRTALEVGCAASGVLRALWTGFQYLDMLVKLRRH